MVLKSSHMALNVTQSCMCLEEGHLFIKPLVLFIHGPHFPVSSATEY